MENRPDSELSAQLPAGMVRMVQLMAFISVILIGPFSINNFIQGRLSPGFFSLLVIAIFVFNAYIVSKNRRYYPNLIIFCLLPAVLFFLSRSLPTQGIIGVYWCYPAILTFYLILPERKAWFANVVILVVATPLIWWTIDQALAARAIVTLMLVSILAAIFVNVISQQHSELQRQAVTDPLTGVLNRVLLHTTLEEAIQQHQRANIPMTLATLDLDHFKKVNDKMGHDVGDEVLKATAEILKNRCRSVDKVFRLGGEEFLLFLYNTTPEDAEHLAEDIRVRIEALQTIPNYQVTASLGLASLQTDESWEEWMKQSDSNLYKAKQQGRNRIVLGQAQTTS